VETWICLLKSLWNWSRKTHGSGLNHPGAAELCGWFSGSRAWGLVGLVENVDKIRSWFETRVAYVTQGEITCLNEGVLRIAESDSEARANEMRSEFLASYRTFGHVNDQGQPIWENDVHTVRDINLRDKWLVAIDMYPGASSKQCMVEGKNEMLSVLEGKPAYPAANDRRTWENRIGRFLHPAEPLCYEFAKFEKVNGTVLTQTTDVQYQRGLGSCERKLLRSTGKQCYDP